MGLFGGVVGAARTVWGFPASHVAQVFGSEYLHEGTNIREVRVRPAFGADFHGIEAVRRSNRQWLGEWEATLPPGSSEALPTMAGYRKRAEKQMRDGLGLNFVIEVDGDIAGTVSVAGVQHGAMSVGNLGYWIGEAWAGQGVTSLAVAAVIDTTILTLGLHRLEINVRPENAPSLGLCRKLGLRHEGLKPRYMCINGVWRDHVGFSVDREMLNRGSLVKTRILGQ
jgi:Acetyltransferases, including N-acetylases of ribosomal proteins